MALNILLMDDDSAAYLIYERMVRDKFGTSVTLDHCRDENCLDDVLTTKRYAAVILDQKLSNGTLGLQLIPTIRKASPGTRILLNSAFGDENLAAQAIDAGVDAYVMGRKQNDEELLRILQREIEGFGRVETITSELRNSSNDDIRAEVERLRQGLQERMEKFRGRQRDRA